MESVTTLARPRRWDTPFGKEMTDADVTHLREQPIIREMDAGRFPSHTPLEGILRNDCRIVHYGPGDIVVREGDYGNSAFLVLIGDVRITLQELPREVLGRAEERKSSIFETLAQSWTNSRIPEVRELNRYNRQDIHNRVEGETRTFIQDFPAVLDKYRTAHLQSGSLFGELAALGRIPRTATAFAETETQLLEIRWQGLREIRKYDDGFRDAIDANYRRNALTVHLQETPLFSGLDAGALSELAKSTLFETYGKFDWNVSYTKLREAGQADVSQEPIIAREGEYVDGLLMIRAGFARVSVQLGSGNRTVSYLGAGDHFGLDELYESWQSNEDAPLKASLSALGYVDVLRVPGRLLEDVVFPHISPPDQSSNDLLARPVSETALLEWAVEERFINGTQAMLIDLDRCVRCDDCVRACAATHGGNPRFIRHGKTFDHWMVANACMHCADPVCMIGCPTGAIHRTRSTGMVVINDDTCIGCATCANSCPYNNIQMVEIRDGKGQGVVDPDTDRPILKATKCDLCSSNPGGPACVRACPHDALRRVDFQLNSLLDGRDT